MPDFLVYVLKSALLLTLFFLVYHLIFRKDTFLLRNRIYLLSAYLLSAVIPFVRIRTTPVPEGNGDILYSLVGLSAGLDEHMAAFPVPASSQWVLFLAGGALLVLSLVLFGFFKLGFILRKAERSRLGRAILALVQMDLAPFSFARYIVLPSRMEAEDRRRIIRHEMAHIEQRHYLDLFVSTLFVVIQWFNPFAWWMRRALTENHEYAADRYSVIKEQDSKPYQYLLLRFAVGPKRMSMAMTHHFNHQLLKKRIAMMNRKKSSHVAGLKSLLLIPLAFTAFIFFSGFSSGEKSRAAQDDIQEIRKFMFRNTKYPKEAAVSGTSGTIYLELGVKRGEVYTKTVKKPKEDLLVGEVITTSYAPDGYANISATQKSEGMVYLETECLRVGELLVKESGLNLKEILNDPVVIPFVFELQSARSVKEDQVDVDVDVKMDSEVSKVQMELDELRELKELEEMEVEVQEDVLNDQMVKRQKEMLQMEQLMMARQKEMEAAQLLKQEQLQEVMAQMEKNAAEMQKKQEQLVKEMQKAQTEKQEISQERMQEMLEQMQKEVKEQQKVQAQNLQQVREQFKKQQELQQVKQQEYMEQMQKELQEKQKMLKETQVQREEEGKKEGSSVLKKK